MPEIFEMAIPGITLMIGAVALVFLIDGIADLIMDAMFVTWRLYRRFVFMRQHRQLSAALLDPEPEQPAAMLIPAWHEDNVIAQMLERTIRTLKYSNYVIFVGVYPNDPKTIAAVESVRARHPDKVAIAVLDHGGPTTKADCLNGVLNHVYRYEAERGVRFAFFVMDDAEDLVPAYELKVLNHLIPRKDLVQLAVFPTKVKWWEFTAGHYMDEFAVLHLKDMRTREWITGIIPSAGVGTGFSRRAMDTATALGNGKPFNENTLTEDYEMLLKLGRAHLSEAFLDSVVVPAHDGTKHRWADDIPAIRSAFPRTLSAAIRQKSRWVLGIALQGWEHLGWQGSFAHRYMLFRDRRALVGNLANVAGYALVLLTFAVWIARYLLAGDGRFPDVIPADSWIWPLMVVNFMLMCVQLSIRAAATTIIYGPVHGVLSAPRAVWANVINFMATLRALRQYFSAKRQKVVIPWEKTTHEFPG